MLITCDTAFYAITDINPCSYIILSQLDQPGFGLPGRSYYLEDQFIDQQNAYVKFASSVAVMFGADQAMADSEMRDMFKFESELANVRNLLSC